MKTTEQTKQFIDQNNLHPVYVYEDLHLDETKKLIYNELKTLSGIYLILNTESKDFYIGSASTGRFFSRFANHLIYFRGNKILKHAVKKHGLSKFSFMVIELFPHVVDKDNNKDLLNIEDFYLKSLTPNYNILTEAGSSFGYKHTEITRIKMRSSYSPERRKLIGDLNKGKNLSLETRNKIKASKLGLSIMHTEQGKLNMKKNSKPIIVYNKDRTVYGEFDSIISAALNLNCNEKTIRRALNTEKKFLLRKYIVNYKK